MSEKRVYVMRGLPGSGKSFWAKNVLPLGEETPVVLSVDDYFTDKGEYNFRPSELGEAHNACLRNFSQLLSSGVAPLVVDNTNISLWEISPYYRLAEAMGYIPEIVWIHRDPKDCAMIGLHKVPEKTIKRMAQLLKEHELPSWWKIRHVEYPKREES